MTEKETGNFCSWSGIQNGNLTRFTCASSCKTVTRGFLISCRQEEIAGKQTFIAFKSDKRVVPEIFILTKDMEPQKTKADKAVQYVHVECVCMKCSFCNI